jgi:membrane-bound lytic murein transglycosylase D
MKKLLTFNLLLTIVVWTAFAEAPAESRPLRTVETQAPSRFFVISQPESKESIPGLDNPVTQHFIEFYTHGRSRKWFWSTLQRAEYYLYFIKKELDRRDMPEELLYLPVIESAYKTSAKSHAGAAGLWQFMSNSVKPYMRIDHWVDERYDFIKSTRAALSKLTEDYKRFGNWPLALAAYNAGGGAIGRITAAAVSYNYWDLAEQGRLKKETALYVPKLLAVHHILSNPRRYGFEDFWPETQEWEQIDAPPEVNIVRLAKDAGVDHKELLAANCELRQGVTPPWDGYQLKVPKEKAQAVEIALNQQPLVR